MKLFRRIGVIYRKDLVDALRDRRTLVAMVIIPVVLYPALMLVVMQSLKIQKQKLEREQYRVLVPDDATKKWLEMALTASSATDTAATRPATNPSSATSQPAEPDAPGLRARLGPQHYRIDVRPKRADQPTDEYAKSAMAEQHYEVVLTLDPPPGNDDGDPPNRSATLWFDAAEVRSNIAQGGLGYLLDIYSDALIERRLNQRNIPTTLLSPLSIHPASIASPQKLGGSLLGQIMPFLLVIITISGAIYPAIDLTAGERERGTLETLMAAPVPILHIVAGKFLVILTITLVIASLNLLSIGATVKYSGIAEAISRSMPGGGVSSIPLGVLPIVLAAMIPFAVLFSAVMLAVCSFARTFKEAQNYMMPVMIGAMLPAMVVSYMPTLKLTGALAVMPVANVVALIRELFLGKHDPAAIAMVMGSTCLYAIAAVVIAGKLYGQEAVLFTDVGSYKTLLMRRFIRAAFRPSAASALLLAAIIFPVQFYWQSSFISIDSIVAIEQLAGRFRWVIAGCQLLCYAAPVLFLTWYFKLDFRGTLSMQMPRPAAWAGALLIIAGIVPVLSWMAGLQHQWFPPSPDEMQSAGMEQSLIRGGWLPVVLLVFGVLPGICEELLFRGFLLAGLRTKLKPLSLCVAVGLIFGLYHIQFSKIPLIALLGMLLAFVCWRSGSIYLSMLIHAANNSLMLAGAEIEWLGVFLGQNSETPGPAWVLPAGVACMIAGIVIVTMTPRSANAVLLNRG